MAGIAAKSSRGGTSGTTPPAQTWPADRLDVVIDAGRDGRGRLQRRASRVVVAVRKHYAALIGLCIERAVQMVRHLYVITGAVAVGIDLLGNQRRVEVVFEFVLGYLVVGAARPQIEWPK